jgi:hypothetical protein
MWRSEAAHTCPFIFVALYTRTRYSFFLLSVAICFWLQKFRPPDALISAPAEAIGPAIQRKARSMLKSWSDGHSQDGAREHLLKRFKCKIRPRLRWPNEFTANKDKKRSFFGVTEAFGGLWGFGMRLIPSGLLLVFLCGFSVGGFARLDRKR